jgi:endonuclease/exonuclease/phosphatase family metal-dependent hydrolase
VADRRPQRSAARHGTARLLRIASYNVHYCIGTDRRFSPNRIARVISHLRADIVALQEVGWHYRGRAGLDQFEFLHEQTGLPLYRGLTRSHERAHFGNAILTRLPVREQWQHDLSVPLRAPRGAIELEIELGGTVLRLLNTHLGLDPWERRDQVGQLTAAIDDRVPTLLVGDFNEWRDRPQMMADLESKLPHRVAPPSFHTRRPFFRYDRIYGSKHVVVLGSGVEKTALTRRASDHLPVYAHVEVVD